MDRSVCRYAILRFAPYSDTGEFANIGIVMYSSNLNFFGFKVDCEDRGGRISKFFHINDKDVFKFAVKAYKRELSFISEQVSQKQLSPKEAFEYFVKPRSTMLRYSDVRTAFVLSAPDSLLSIYKRMVSHSSADKKRSRKMLPMILRQQLDTLKLEVPFRRHKFEKHGYKAVFDFAQVDSNEKPLKLIQPIELDKIEKALDIFKIADANEIKLKRIDSLGLLPSRVLLPFSVQDNIDGESEDAWRIVKSELEKIGELVDINNKSSIEKFAKS